MTWLVLAVQLAAAPIDDAPKVASASARLLMIDAELASWNSEWDPKLRSAITASLATAGAGLGLGAIGLLFIGSSYGFFVVASLSGAVIGGVALLIAMGCFMYGAVTEGVHEWKRQALLDERERLLRRLSKDDGRPGGDWSGLPIPVTLARF